MIYPHIKNIWCVLAGIAAVASLSSLDVVTRSIRVLGRIPAINHSGRVATLPIMAMPDK